MTAHVVGVGMTRFTKTPELTHEELARTAIAAALADAGIEASELDAFFCGSVFGGLAIGQRVARASGIGEIPIVNLENACASSGGALREAHAWVASGGSDLALVLGVEMLTNMGGGLVSSDAHGASQRIGLTLPGLYAMRASRYMAEHGASAEDLASVAVKNRRNGSRNDKAHFRDAVATAEVLESTPIATPLTLLQCCPNVDGAAAVIVASDAALRRLGSERAVKIAGWGMVSGNALDVVGSEPTATARAGQAAYERAGVGPDDIDVCEVHEPFTIAEIEHIESLGFCEHGEGAAATAQGRTEIDGDLIAVNPSGGLIARGHPLGASGAAQVVEIVTQLRGEAGDRQRDGARVGMAHIMGGNIPEIDSNACVVHIFTR
jgi:acetyl-CoA acetyltransferase